MSDSWYFFWQREAKSTWNLALASERERIIREEKPELTTIMDVNFSFDSDQSEDKDKLKYKGPCYFDFDSEDLDEVIPNFQQFLTNLKAKGVNLNALRLYASGGKGFHIEMSPVMLMGKVPPHGVQALPLLYREVAQELYVNTLDMRVYSLNRGRQWRCPNVKRSNGNYKVQITADEAFEMTAERYLDLIKHSRPTFPVEDAVFVPDMALVYAKAREKVDKGLKSRKSKKKPVDELKRFNGEWPETIRGILQGQGLKDDVGWNFIAMQLALAAVSLGKKEEELKADAQVLLETYAGGDSSRYNSPRKRWVELHKQFHYMLENPCYEFSVGGILSLVEREVADKSDLTLGEYVPDEEVAEDEPPEDDGAKVRVAKSGIYTKGEHGWRNISHMGLSDPILLLLPDGTRVGYDLEMYIKGKPQGRKMLNIQSLSTKAALHQYSVGFNVSFKGTDMDAANLLDAMRDRVESKSRISLVTQVEGVDLILPPDAKSESELQVIWASEAGVLSTSKNHQFSYRPLNKDGATFKSDLAVAPDLSNCDEDRQMIADMLAMNSPHNLAKVLGWFSACFVCPVLRRFYSQFPLLMVFGGATAGKSKTIALLNHMHYHLRKPRILQASGMTKFPLLIATSATSSIPLVLEEFRPRLMRTTGMLDMIINTLKSNYDGHDQTRGALSESGRGATVNEYANTAPIVFTAEEQNGEVAIQERSVHVSMTKGDRLGRDAAYMRLLSRSSGLGRLGKAILMNVMALDLGKFRQEFDDIHMDVRQRMGKQADGRDRPMYNMSVTLMGLRLMHRTIAQVFGDEFDDQFDTMTNLILDNIGEFVPANMSESARILDVMAQLTKTLDVTVRLEPNKDYYVDEAARTVDIKLKPAYAKYMKYTRSLGLAPLLETDSAFIAAMSRYEGTKQRSCPSSPLFDNPLEAIFQFDLDHLAGDGVEPFKP